VKSTKARACLGKIPHPTRGEADEHRQRLIDGEGACPDSVEVYRCRHDHSHFHVGHVKHGKRKAAA
jgi:hypothetical protein